MSSCIVFICVLDIILYRSWIFCLSADEMFFKTLKMNIGGEFGLISVSNKCRYAVIFSLIVLLTSRAKNNVSFSAIFSISKSWESATKSGRLCCFFSSL